MDELTDLVQQLDDQKSLRLQLDEAIKASRKEMSAATKARDVVLAERKQEEEKRASDAARVQQEKESQEEICRLRHEQTMSVMQCDWHQHGHPQVKVCKDFEAYAESLVVKPGLGEEESVSEIGVPCVVELTSVMDIEKVKSGITKNTIVCADLNWPK